jgi:transcriptional regulator with XRE-family HTH domain
LLSFSLKVNIEYFLTISVKYEIEINFKIGGAKLRGDRLKQLRKDNGMSQLELSKLLGCVVSLVSMYESGDKTPSAEKLQSLAELFRVSTDYLLGVEVDIECNDYGKKLGLTDAEIKEALEFAAKMKKKR